MDSVARIREEKALIDDRDFSDNFRVNQDVLMELAPREESADPEFRRDFFALAEKLKSTDHPAILRLYSFGEHEGRLYRTWANRPLFSVASLATENSRERRHQIAQALEGFQLLTEIGISLENYGANFLSFCFCDRTMFIARYPFTSSSSPRCSGCTPNFVYFAVPPNYQVLGEKCFLIHLGVFIGFSLVGEFSFVKPPMFCKRDGVPIVRRELPLESPLKEVVDRLTQLDPEKNYPDLSTGLQKAKEALLVDF